MKNIILKTPSLVFVALVLLPVIYVYFLWQPGDHAIGIFELTLLISYLVGALWLLSILDYMTAEAKSDEYARAIYILIAIELFTQVSALFLRSFMPDPLLAWVLRFAGLAVLLAIGALMTKIIKKVFYARTSWWVFVEIVVIPIGMFTLTPDIQAWEKGDKT